MKRQTMMINKILTVLGAGSLALSASAAHGQNVTVFQGLPPLPPNIPSLNEAPKDQNQNDFDVIPVPSRPPAPIQEFNFEAPRSVVAPTSLPTGRQYRVEISSVDPQILATVKQVEPSAFLKGDRIQAGSFSKPENAQTLKANLQAKGITANVVEVSLGGTAIGSSREEGGYFVAIPTRGNNAGTIQSQLQQAGINPNLIQEKTAPRGRHIAIGPFSNRQEAELLNSRIRAADLDGRLYFHN